MLREIRGETTAPTEVCHENGVAVGRSKPASKSFSEEHANQGTTRVL